MLGTEPRNLVRANKCTLYHWAETAAPTFWNHCNIHLVHICVKIFFGTFYLYLGKYKNKVKQKYIWPYKNIVCLRYKYSKLHSKLGHIVSAIKDTICIQMPHFLKLILRFHGAGTIGSFVFSSHIFLFGFGFLRQDLNM